MADEWNLNMPPNTELISDLPSEHRQRKTNVAAVIEKEHATLGDSNSGGEHKQGSAVMWHLATASIPALQPDGTALTSSDNGRLWHDTTTDIVYVLEDYSDPTVGNGWVAIGHYLGDIAINTDKFTVARATGNTAIAGTLGVTGVATVAKGSLSASSDAPTTDAMLSNKKYVDDQWTPTAYAGGESVMIGNGLIIKMGQLVVSATSGTLTYGTAFPTAVISVILTAQRDSGLTNTDPTLVLPTVSKFGWTVFDSGANNLHWIAIGY